MLRAALIGTRIADRLGLEPDRRDCIYYTTLVMWIGCHADSHEFAQWFGDDIAVRRDSYLIDWSGLPYYRFLAGNIGRGLSETNIGRALEVGMDLFNDRPYNGSRLIMLVSDGGDRMDPDTRERLAHLARKQRVSIYWLYLRSSNSPGLALAAEREISAARPMDTEQLATRQREVAERNKRQITT